MILLAIRDDGLGLAELIEHEHDLAALDLLDLTGQQVADPRRELVTDLGALALADALHDALLGRLHGRAAELGELHRDLHEVARLIVGVLVARFFDGDLANGVLHVLHDLLEDDDADIALVVIDLHLRLHGRAVLLGEGGEDAVLEQFLQFPALDLLQIRELADRSEDLSRTGHPGLLLKESLRFPVECEAGVDDVCQRDLVFDALPIPQPQALLTRLAFDRDDLHLVAPLQRAAVHTRASADEALPVRRLLERPFHARRRHLEHVPSRDEVGCGIETRFDRARRAGTIPHLHLLPIQPIDPDVEHRTPLRATTLEFDQLEPKWAKLFNDKGFDCVVHRSPSGR